VAGGTRVMRYDNETGKGDHKHIGDQEVPYEFADLDRLLEASGLMWKVEGLEDEHSYYRHRFR
jgi:Family of unknown function (DUF6516)